MNPNYRDEYDLYYTAMHWCARRCHLRAMRMLRRARAEVNILNEFGQSPLILSALTRHPPPMTHKQQKTIKYLINQGALVNLRDRGGYCALDYAVSEIIFKRLFFCLTVFQIVGNEPRCIFYSDFT